MLLQTNSYIVPKTKRPEHERLMRRFRQTLARLGCDQFEVYEQVGANWGGGENGRYVQIMRFRDRKHQLAVQSMEKSDPAAQTLIAEFCDLVNFPYQQQQGLFAVGFYSSALPVATRRSRRKTERTRAMRVSGVGATAGDKFRDLEAPLRLPGEGAFTPAEALAAGVEPPSIDHPDAAQTLAEILARAAGQEIEPPRRQADISAEQTAQFSNQHFDALADDEPTDEISEGADEEIEEEASEYTSEHGDRHAMLESIISTPRDTDENEAELDAEHDADLESGEFPAEAASGLSGQRLSAPPSSLTGDVGAAGGEAEDAEGWTVHLPLSPVDEDSADHLADDNAAESAWGEPMPQSLADEDEPTDQATAEPAVSGADESAMSDQAAVPFDSEAAAEQLRQKELEEIPPQLLEAEDESADFWPRLVESMNDDGQEPDELGEAPAAEETVDLSGQSLGFSDGDDISDEDLAEIPRQRPAFDLDAGLDDSSAGESTLIGEVDLTDEARGLLSAGAENATGDEGAVINGNGNGNANGNANGRSREDETGSGIEAASESAAVNDSGDQHSR